MKALPPKVPTPFKLYSDAKIGKFLAEAANANEAREKCRETFKELNDKQRLKWIYKSLQLESKYNVSALLIFKFIDFFNYFFKN